MPFPKLETGRVDTQVTNILLAYTNDEFIAEQVLPTVPNLSEESGKIPVLGNSHLRTYSTKRALYDESEHRMEFTIDNSDTYNIDYHDLSIYAPDRLRDQLQKPFDIKRDAGLSLRQAIMLERETALATMLSSTAILTNNTTLSGTSQWNDYVNSTPEDNIETARTSIQNKIGKEANGMVIGRKVFNTLKRHPFFLNMVRGINVLSPDMLTQLLKDYFELKYVLVGRSIYVNSKEGQSETKTSVWGNNCVLFYRPETPSLLQPSFGYSFALAGENLRFSTRRHPNDKGDLHTLDYAYQDKVLDVSAAYLVKNAVA